LGWASRPVFFERKKNKNQKLIKMLSALSLASDPPRLIIGVNGDGHAASYRPVEVSCMLLFQFEFNLYVYNKIYFLGRPLSLRVGADLCERAKAGADFVVALQVDSAHVNISKKAPLPTAVDFPCTSCTRSFRTQQGLHAHQRVDRKESEARINDYECRDGSFSDKKIPTRHAWFVCSVLSSWY